MKKTKYIPFVYLLTILILPCITAYFFFDRWFPFWLTGKQFLKFFLMYMAVGYGIIFLDKMIERNKPDQKINLAGATISLTLVLSLSRIIQGLHHHKPIGYLVLLTTVHVIILVILNKNGSKKMAA
jgi:hypothetical protein